MDLGLKDKVALVTGVGSQIGFGRGIAVTLAKEGCDIIAADRDLEGAQKTSAEVEAVGRKVIPVKVDVSNGVEVKEMVETALAKFGKIDILVNNAGASTPPKPFMEMTEAEWDRDININLKGVLYCSQAVLKHMIPRKSGKIVNMSSLGINVNSIAPGAGKTGFAVQATPEFWARLLTMIPLGRSTTPQDIANMVAFLVSDVSSDIVGQTISVDGGMTMY